MDMVEKVARAMMAVTAARPGDPNGDAYPVLAMDPDYDDLPRDETEGTADDEITQAAVLALARAAIRAMANPEVGRQVGRPTSAKSETPAKSRTPP